MDWAQIAPRVHSIKRQKIALPSSEWFVRTAVSKSVCTGSLIETCLVVRIGDVLSHTQTSVGARRRRQLDQHPRLIPASLDAKERDELHEPDGGAQDVAR